MRFGAREMVERGGVTVDWFEARGGRGGGGGEGGGREGVEEGGMEMEVGRRRGAEEWGRSGEDDDEDEEGRRKKTRRGMSMMMRGKEEQEMDAENAEESMLELRLSLAVAISVPSPQRQQQQQQQSVAPAQGSFVVHRHQTNQSHNHNGNHRHHQQHQGQQLGSAMGGGRNQSPSKPLLMQRPSSPIANHRDLPRPNLTASLKHLVSQQQPVKVTSVQRIPGGTARQSLQQYGVSSLPQLHSPHVPPLGSSPSLQDGLDSGLAHFQNLGRLGPSAQTSATSQQASVLLGQVGQRQQSAHLMNSTHESLFQKGFPHHNQPRHSPAQRIYSRTPSAAAFHQQQSGGGKELVTQQGQQQLGPLGHNMVSSFSPSSRIFATGSYAAHISSQAINLPVTGAQLQAFSQHQSSNSVSVASLRQTQPPVSTLGKSPSVSFAVGHAFSVVRPAISGTIPSNICDIPPRERSGDVHHVVVNVSDRKVKLTSDVDATSLYALCRRWVRNDVHRRDQSVLWDCPPLPRPLPAAAAAETGPGKIGSTENPKKEEAARVSQIELPGPIESMTEKELLEHHVEHFKDVRKRFRDGRMQRIARFMPRLALLLPVNAENSRRDADQSHP